MYNDDDDQSFCVAGLQLWNNRPFHLRYSELTLLEFRRLLMMHLSRRGLLRLLTIVSRACYLLRSMLYISVISVLIYFLVLVLVLPIICLSVSFILRSCRISNLLTKTC